MKATESTLSKVLTDNRIYEIPRYQRPYSWDEDNTEELINDIFEAYEDRQPEYFIGSIIVIEKEKDRLFEVVDGQQRLITLNLILAKLRDLIDDAPAKAMLNNRICPKNVLTGEKEKPRLIVRKQEQHFFSEYILDARHDVKADTETQQRFEKNFEKIGAYLKDKSEQTLKLFADYLLNHVYVVHVTTESFASAHRLFNVLNTRGLSLSNGDLLKNKLYEMCESKKDREEIIEEEWKTLEETIGQEQLDTFLSHHRTALTGNKQKRSLFNEYLNLLQKDPVNPASFCEKLVRSAGNYQKIKDNDFTKEKNKRLIASLLNVSYDDWTAPLLAFMNSVADIENDEFFRFLSLLERITVQNWVRRLSASRRITGYHNVINDINRNKGANTESIIRGEANNEEFIDCLKSDMYRVSYAKAILLRLEQEQFDDSVTKTYNGSITIEHVLPQKMKKSYWLKRFTEEQHREWVHKLGNLTLLSGSKNSEAQCEGFDKKKQIYRKKGRKVSFDLTKEICKETEWTPEIIETRHKKLLKQAKKIWNI